MPRLRVLAAACGLLLSVAVALVGTAAPAAAHAVVVRTVPAAGVTLASSPKLITFMFSHRVSAGREPLRLFDSAGVHVPLTDVSVSDRVLGGWPARPLSPGRYTAIARVLSADTHAIGGEVTFTVAATPPPGSPAVSPSAVPVATAVNPVAGALPVTRPTAQEEHGSTDMAVRLGRLFELVGLVLGGGFAAGVLFVIPPNERRRLGRGLIRAATAGAVAVAAGRLMELAGQAARLSDGRLVDLSLADLWSVLSAGAPRYPTAVVIEVGGAVVVALALRRHHLRHRHLVAALAGVAVAAGLALSGHAVDATWPAGQVVAAITHGASGAVWLGLLFAVWSGTRLAGPDQVLRDEIGRRARHTAVAVLVVVVATGVIRALGTLPLDRPFDTSYGVILAAKLIAVVAVLAVATRCRRHAQPGAELGRLARSVRLETMGLAVVIGFAAMLATTSPDRSPPVPAPRTVVAAADGAGGTAEVELSPGTVGVNQARVRFPEPSSDDVTLVLTLPAQGMAALPRQIHSDRPTSVVLALPGTWEAEVLVHRAGRLDRKLTAIIRIP